MKKLKLDEAGDSEDLQALFDSIAAEAPAKVKLEVVPEAANFSGDSPDLEALFDEVSEHYETSSPNAEPAATHEHDAHSCDTVYKRVGTLARELHDTLRELGYDDALEDVAKQIPDARSRLNYVAQMTEQAASRVLNATDIVMPILDNVDGRNTDLAQRWERLYRNELSVEEFKQLAQETRSFFGQLSGHTRVARAQLTEIMMAQDFQDLTGQVIKKTVDMAQKLENGLVQVLIEAMPESKRAETPEGLLNGPVVNGAGRDDVVTSQEQVDDLLESLGF